MKDRADTIEKHVAESFQFIQRAETPAKFSIRSSNPDLDGGTASTNVSDGNFHLTFRPANIKVLGQDERKALLRSNTVLECHNDNSCFVFDMKSFTEATIRFQAPLNVQCKVKGYRNQSFSLSEKRFHRAIIGTHGQQKPGNVFESTPLRIGTKYWTCGLLKTEIEHRMYHLFSYADAEKKDYTFIDSVTPADYETFRSDIDNILLGYSFASGYLPRGSRYCISSDEANFINPVGVLFETLGKSFESLYTAVPDSKMLTSLDIRPYMLFPQQTLNTLCDRLRESEELRRVIQLVVEGHTLSSLGKAIYYSVAIETMTGIVMEENKGRFDPIVDKKIAKELVAKLHNVLNDYEDQVSPEGLETLRRKVNGLNTPTNRQKLLKPFDLYGIPLTEAEKDCVKARNDFLHGTGRSASHDADTEFTLEWTGLALMYCITALVLKYLGYSGYVVYRPAIHQHNMERPRTDPIIKMI